MSPFTPDQSLALSLLAWSSYKSPSVLHFKSQSIFTSISTLETFHLKKTKLHVLTLTILGLVGCAMAFPSPTEVDDVIVTEDYLESMSSPVTTNVTGSGNSADGGPVANFIPPGRVCKDLHLLANSSAE